MMTPLSPLPANETNQDVHGEAVSTSNPQQAPLRRAVYVKVVDLANINNLDIEKIKVETERKRKELTLKTATSSTGDDSNASRDDESSTNPRYQKRIVPSTGGFNLCLLVGNINIVVEKTRVDKSQVRLAECEVGDETGMLSLRARDEQISMLEEISKRKGAVVLRNCSLELYQGKFIRLAVSKWGKIHSFPDGISSTPTPPLTINERVHLSIVDLNEVAGEEWNDSILAPNSPSRSSQRDDHLSSGTDNYTGRDKQIRHSPRQRSGSRGRGTHGYQSHPKEKRNNRYKKANPGGGYNANVMHMVPGMPSLPLYAAPHYNFSRFDQHAMQNLYHQPQNQQQQQQQQVHQENYSYMSYQEYTMRMQMEAMRISYQHQAPQHQHQNRGDRQMYHPDAQGLQVLNQNPNAFADPSGHQPQIPPPHQTVHASSPSPDSTGPFQSSEGGSSPYIAVANNAETWSIKQEAESPTMNPHAAVFNSAQGTMPNLTLPANQYYAQNASMSLSPYMQVGQLHPQHQGQGQAPIHVMPNTDAQPISGSREPSLKDGSDDVQ